MARKVNPEGRCIVRSFSYPRNFDVVMEKINEICQRERISFSELIVSQLKEYVKEHGESQNPQTKLSLFEIDGACAIPNIYEIRRNPEIARKFYQFVERKEYKILDEGLNILLLYHNKRDKWLLDNGT